MAKKIIGSAQATIVSLKDGVDSNLLDWVQDWNSNKTVIDLNSVITPKIFAGIKNSNGTITGIALGKYKLSVRNSKGTIITENIEGIYGFKDGIKTFAIDATGDVLIGNGNQSVKYNAITGKIEFGTDVSLNWINVANNAKAEAISTAANDATAKSEKAKNDAISVAEQNTNNKLDAIEIGGTNLLQNSNELYIIEADKSGTHEKLIWTDLFLFLEKDITYTFSCKTDGIWGNVTGTNTVEAFLVKDKVYDNGGIQVDSNPFTFVPRVSGCYFIRLDANHQQYGHSFWDFKIEKGNKCTDWSPAPQDIQAAISEAKSAGQNAQEVADAITKKSVDENWETKLTYIDQYGIFTGTLSANTVNTVKLNASQISAGIIDVARLNVAALKSELITAGNINALNLDVVQGKIGGWSIDSDSIYRGIKNNSINSYTTASGAITIGSNGIRGYKWKLESNGSGALAGGNITWDENGNVSFSSSVSLNWTNKVNEALKDAKLYSDSLTKNIKVGGTNLLPNTNKGTAGWGYVVQNGTNKYSEVSVLGVRACKSTCTAASTGYHVLFHSINRNLIKNTTEYTISFDVLCDFDTFFNFRIMTQNGLNQLIIWEGVTIKKNTWVRVERTATTNDNTNTEQVLYIVGFNKIGSVTLANLKLEEGNKATAWSPSLEDTAKEIESAQNTANTAKTTADTATKRLNDWASDSIISPTEKTALKQQLADIKAECADINRQAGTYGLYNSAEWTNYASAYNAAVSALNKYTAAIPENIPIAADYNNIAAYYEKRQVMLEKLSSVVKSYADSLVDNITFGGRNLITFAKMGGWSVSGRYEDNTGRCKDIDTDQWRIQSWTTYQVGRYSVSFWAKADVAGTVVFDTCDQNLQNLNLTTSWQFFKFENLYVSNYLSAPYYGFLDFYKGTSSIKYLSLSNLKLEYGTKCSDYTVSPEDLELSIDNAKKTAETAKSTADTATKRLNDWASDSIISPTEKTALKQQLADIKAECVEINRQVGTYGLSTATEWTNYASAYNAAASALNKYTAATPENIPIAADYNNIAAYYEKRQVVLNKIVAVAKAQSDTIQISANNAQSSANTANIKLGEIANDNLLTTSEKQDALKEWQIIQGEYPVIMQQATTYALYTASYSVSYEALKAYINPLLANINSNSTIVGNTFRNTFKAYYDEKIKLIKSVTDKAKSIADAAQKSADDIQVGGRNLIRNSDFSNSLKYWTRQNDGILSVDDSVQFAGKASLKIASTTKGFDGIRSTAYKIDFLPEQEYTLSFWAYRDSSKGIFSPDRVLRVYLPENNGATLVNYHHYLSVSTSNLDDKKWTKFTILIKTKNGTSFNALFFDYLNNSLNPIHIWIANVILEKGNKASDWTLSAEDVYENISNTASKKVRYIRDWINGSTVNTGNHWVQIMAYDDAGNNVALNKAVSGNISNSRITNGNLDTSSYISAAAGILQHAIVDLGNIYEIQKIKVWHYYGDPRIYHATKTECSIDGNYWFTIFDSNIEGTYRETVEGKTIYVKEYDRSTYKAIEAKEVADAITKKAADEKWDTKLTYIDQNGIFTGVLSANTVNAVKINASQITAGTIDVARLNVAVLKSTLITASNIEALTLNVAKGKVGGWNITKDSIEIGSIGSYGSSLLLRSSTAGAGNIFTGGTRLYGLSILWYQNLNAGHIVFGQIGANGTSIKAGYLGIQMLAYDGTEYFCLSANSTKTGSKEVYNRIAGWAFDNTRIWKNNVSLGADGSIQNGNLWQLNNNGSGRLANGNIVWDASGNVTFGSSVSLNWTKAADNALNAAKTYAETKKAEAITHTTNVTNATKELAQAMAFGRMLYRDPTFYNGINGVTVYNNSSNGTVTITRASDNNAPNDSKQVLVIKNTGACSPGCGGFFFATVTSYRKVFIARIIAKIPIGRNISFHSNGFGTGGTVKWLTSVAGTGDWCEYIHKLTCGTTNFNTTNFFAINGAVGTTEAPVEWRVAYATVFDVTSTEKYTTTIDANGIYTSSLNANQITAGTIHADRIATGSITAVKLDATSIKASVINTDYINGLTLNFVKGKIGGWNIQNDQISIGSLNVVGQIPIQIRSCNSGSGYVYNGQFKPYGVTLSWYQSNNAGHIGFGQVLANGNTIRSGFMGIQMMAWNNAEYFCLSANTQRSGSLEVYNRIAGWGFDHQRIWKNNVYLGADGSIQNSTKWQFNNDGSGRVASGNIVWDAAGNVTFGPNVALNWTNAATNALNNAKSYADSKVNNIHIGGRNYAQKTSYTWSNPVTLNNVSNHCVLPILVLAEDWKAGDIISVSFDYKYENLSASTTNKFITLQGSGNVTGWTDGFSGYNFFNQIDFVAGSGIVHITYQFPLTSARAQNSTFSLAIRHDFISGKVCIRNFKVEKGSKPTEWSPAPEDIENRLTKITATGIYTGEIAANQIKVDSTLVVGGSSFNGSISVRDAANAVKVTLDRNGINAVGGVIGGWNISASQLSKNSVILGSDGSIVNGSKWKLNSDGSGQVASGNVSWTAAGAVSLTGTINATSGKIGGFTISGNTLKNSATDTSIRFDNLSGSSFLNINDTSTLLAIRADSARTAISISTFATGAEGLHIVANAGSTAAIQSFGTHTFGQRQGESWNAPGVLFSALVKNNTTLLNKWGNGMKVTSFSKISNGGFMCYHNLGHTDYIVVANPYWDTATNWHGNCFIRIEFITANSFKLRVVNADNGGLVDTCFTFAVIGRNKW